MKRSARLINNQTGPMPKILLKFVGFFSIFGVSSKMLLATLIASQQSASSSSTEATGSIYPLIRHTYMLSPFSKHCSGPISDGLRTPNIHSAVTTSSRRDCSAIHLPPLQMAAAIEQAPTSKARGGAANRCHRHSGVEENAGNLDCLTVLALIPRRCRQAV